MTDFPNRLTYRHITIAALIMLMAYLLRVIVLLQRAAVDPTFIPTVGVDQYRYVTFALGLLNGTFPTEPYYLHPGPTYLYGGLLATVAPNWLHLVFITTLIDALSVAWLIGAGWLLTRREWGGYLAGVAFAVYPVAIFYSSTLLIAPLAAHLLALFIFLTLWQREETVLWRTVLLGLVAGAIAVSRLNLVPVLALYGLWLLILRRSWWRLALHGVVFVGMMLLVIAPFTWWNYQSSGKFIPVATTGSLELYMANNRDSAGRHGRTPALDAIDTDYQSAMLRDIQVAPEHFFGLLAYKASLFLSPEEPGNNASYTTTRELSALLQLLPFDFMWLLLIGAVGGLSLWHLDRQAALLLGAIIAWMFISYVLTFAFARLRHPTIIPLIVLSAGLVRFEFRWRRYLPMVGLLLVLGIAWWIRYPTAKLPAERTYAALPVDAIAMDATYGELSLVGWRPISAWQASERAWTTPDQAYTVELFWRLNQPTPREYQFYLGYLVQGERYAGLDRPLGAVSFPHNTTDTWQENLIYGEIVSLRFRDTYPMIDNLPIGGQMVVGAYYWDEVGQIVNLTLPDGNGMVTLQPFAVYEHLADTLSIAPDADIFGDMIALNAVSLPPIAAPNETVLLDFQWQALAEINRNYTVFLHVVDETGEIVAQGDAPPLPTLLTDNWQPNLMLTSQLAVAMPDTSGTYQIYVGLYAGTERLPIANANTDRLLLGTITVE